MSRKRTTAVGDGRFNVLLGHVRVNVWEVAAVVDETDEIVVGVGLPD